MKKIILSNLQPKSIPEALGRALSPIPMALYSSINDFEGDGSCSNEEIWSPETRSRITSVEPTDAKSGLLRRSVSPRRTEMASEGTYGDDCTFDDYFTMEDDLEGREKLKVRMSLFGPDPRSPSPLEPSL
jgi:hypothetical protein